MGPITSNTPPSTSNGFRERGWQRDPSVRRLSHGRLMIEDLVERTEREYQHKTKAGDEIQEFILPGHYSSIQRTNAKVWCFANL